MPRLEVLEGRALPSTFTVANLDDAGPGSLRQAVQDANDNPGFDLIDFAPDVDGTVTLATGQLTITDHLTVAGPGADRLAVSGGDASRVFEVTSGVSVTLSGLAITHGRATQGAGILNAGTLALFDVILADNQAINNAGDGQGGGLFNAAGALVLIDHSVLRDNLASGNPPLSAGGLPGGRGGGLYNEGTALIQSSTLTNNRAVGSSGAVSIGGRGGAIWNGTDGAPAGPAAVLGVFASTLSDNQALGGALFNRHAAAYIVQSTLTGNQALAGPSGAGAGGNFGGGGAIASTTAGVLTTTLVLVSSTLADNQTEGGAGGSLGAGATGSGGALYNESIATIVDSMLTGNRATGGAGGSDRPGGGGFGGAIVNVVAGNLAISHSTFAGNQATGGAGGLRGAGGGAFGGAIDSGAPAVLTLSHSVFADNRAVGGDGGAGAGGGGGFGGGLYLASGTVVLEDSVVTDNEARGGLPGAGGPAGQGVGGGIFIASSLVTLRRTQVTGNHASTSADDIFGVFREEP